MNFHSKTGKKHKVIIYIHNSNVLMVRFLLFISNLELAFVLILRPLSPELVMSPDFEYRTPSVLWFDSIL